MGPSVYNFQWIPATFYVFLMSSNTCCMEYAAILNRSEPRTIIITAFILARHRSREIKEDHMLAFAVQVFRNYDHVTAGAIGHYAAGS
jgi:hypothetical protein